jgi:kynurenine 3-monooxygenase
LLVPASGPSFLPAVPTPTFPRPISPYNVMQNRSITIVGAGLTGPVLAVFLARRGYSVELFDRGPDPRAATIGRGRSINITLCPRGLRPLDTIGAGAAVRRIGVLAKGRVIHGTDGSLERQPYGNQGEALLSVSRAELNTTLVEHAAREPGVRMAFDERCLRVDFETRMLTLENRRTGAVTTREFRHLIGADGAHSVVRQHLQKRPHFDYSQHYCKHGNKELLLPADSSAAWSQERESLHIWPRGQYMLIAFPNRDGTTTCTLHMPLEGDISHASLRDARDVERVFAESFSDVRWAIPDLAAQYFENPVVPMVTIKCAPWSIEDKALLIGDAAHSIWPSYGQGANSAFEDCAVLDAWLERSPDDAREAFIAFERERKPSTDAMADLSIEHFLELRDLVGDPSFLLRKKIERAMSRLFPLAYQPLYSLVSFTHTPYADALALDRRQRKIVDELMAIDGIEERLETPDVARLMEQMLGPSDSEKTSSRLPASSISI